ncbi:methyltransferase domain-containing protein [Streptomyces roseoverticillatus]|uniref:methyltransferase domain-containing protein n=1 Tax=Streptomyces roseoverticillatus TaxID=66429 RepID=UPI0033F1F1F9
MLRKVQSIGKAIQAVATPDPTNRVRRLYELADPERQFTHRSTRYINIGYWEDGTEDPDRAGEALALKLADIAGFEPAHTVLDVGFGYGEQDLAWLRANRIHKVHGLEVSPRHVEGACAQAESEGLQERADFRVGSATELPFEEGTFDRVVALDSALHFYPRSTFLKEALRVLKPGGALAAVDTIPLSGDTPRGTFRSPRFSLYRFSVPDANWYDRQTYARELLDVGFTDVDVTSIRDRTWEGWYRYWTGLVDDPDALKRLHPEAAREFVKEWSDKERIRQELDLLDSVTVLARKP